MAQERCAKLRAEQSTAAEEAQRLKRKVLMGSWGAAQESAAEHASVERKARAYEPNPNPSPSPDPNPNP